MTINTTDEPINPVSDVVGTRKKGWPLWRILTARYKYALLVVFVLTCIVVATMLLLWFLDQDRALRTIWKNWGAVTSHAFTLQINTRHAGVGGDYVARLPVRIDVSGRGVQQERGVDDLEAVFTLSGKYTAEGASIPLDAVVDVRVAGGNAYIKIAKVPPILSLKFGTEAMSLLGKWVELPGGTSNGLTKIADLLLRFQERAPRDFSLLREALVNDFPLVLTPNGTKDGSANNVALLRYNIGADKAKVRTIKDHLLQTLDTTDGQLVVINGSSTEILVHAIDNLTGELLVGEKDLLPRKLTLIFPLRATFAGKTLHETVTIELEFSDFNNVPRILTPSLSAPESKVREDFTDIELIRSRDKARIADIRRLQTALEAYFSANGHYPIYAQKHADTLKVLVPTYISRIPVDPMDKTLYIYNAPGDGSGFFLGASLEDPNNTELLYDDDGKSGNWATLGRDSMGCAMQQHRYCFNVSQRTPEN